MGTGLQSIRTKLLLYAGVVLVVPTLVYGVLAFNAARGALEPSLHEELAGDALAIKAAVQEFLNGHVQNVKTWTGLGAMRELAILDIDKTISQFLEGVKNEYGTYLDVLAVDRSGVCRASSEPSHIGKSFSDEIRRLRPGREPPLPRVAYSADHREFYIGLAMAIPDPDNEGQSLGTMIAMLSRPSLQQVVHAKAGHGHVQLHLIDGGGRILAGTDTSASGEKLSRWEVKTTGSVPYDSGPSPILYEAVTASGEELIVSEAGLDSYRALPDLEWRVIASMPTALVLAPVRGVRDRVFIFGSAVTLVGIAIAWLLSSNLSRPIKDLTGITARIADTGVLESIPEPGSHDEVGELTKSFQKMVENISIAHAELVQSAKLAFLGEMAAGIAHEIRTPLGIIKNSAQLLERRMSKANDPEGVEFAHFVREETDRLNAAVTDLLNFARPAQPDMSPANLNDVVENAGHLLKAEATAKDVDVRLDLASDLPVVVCDASQIRQVCLNLLMNSIQACAGGGQVRVSTSRSGDGTAIIVSDNGPGIPEEVRENLFSPFASKKEGGIGLGLAIVKRIVTAHRGEIEASNEAGGGARFTVWLPLEGAPVGVIPV